MTGREQIGRTRGSVPALFVLFGLLLNVATATGVQLDRDPRAARIGNGEVVRTPTARLAGRIDDDGSGQDDALAVLPPSPRFARLAIAIHPAGAANISAADPRPLDSPSHYRARAPPAA